MNFEALKNRQHAIDDQGQALADVKELEEKLNQMAALLERYHKLCGKYWITATLWRTYALIVSAAFFGQNLYLWWLS